MPRLSYELNSYIKAVENLALKKGFDKVLNIKTGGSVVRFELFLKNESKPTSMWVIHHDHNRKKTIWSKEDYKKAASRLQCTYDELIDEIKKC